MEETVITTHPPTKKFRQRHAEWMLGIVSFTESSFFPIIVDPFLVGMILMKTNQWFRFATIAVITSILGGIFGYVIGAVFFDYIGVRMIEIYNLEETFHETVASADRNAFLFTLIGAFTPVPYKLVVLVGGFLKINFLQFMLASIIGRGARFYIVAYITKRFGEHTLAVYVRKLHLISAAVAIAAVAYAVLAFIG
jgi:membrane protein YqaA with SNARE-associated domain